MSKLGKCSFCDKDAVFAFNNVAAYTIVFPDKTERVISQDKRFCKDHGTELWQQLKAATEQESGG